MSTTAVKGVVQLSDATEYADLGTSDTVINETILKAVVDEVNLVADVQIGGTSILTTKVANIIKTDIMTLIGAATTEANGYMSSEDKTR